MSVLNHWEKQKENREKRKEAYQTWYKKYVYLEFQRYKERRFDRSSIWEDNSWEFPKTEGKHETTDSSGYMNEWS